MEKILIPLLGFYTMFQPLIILFISYFVLKKAILDALKEHSLYQKRFRD